MRGEEDAALIPDAITHLRALVAFDTVSHRPNLPLIGYVEDLLTRHGAACTRLPGTGDGKASLLARIGPEAPGGVILSAHTDVVPVEGQPWTSPPFALTQRGERLYGRGAADMKGFLACVLATLPVLVKENLKRPLYLACTYDEEVGCLGAPELVRHAAAHVPSPWLAIIGEPTGMRVVTAHKGVYSFETTVTGLEAHSSQTHRGVNAVQIACRLVAFLADLAEEYAREGMQNARFDPPFTTIHVGVIQGGTARNIIPRECRFVWEVRPLPGDRAEAALERFESFCDPLRRRMRTVSPQADIVTVMRSHMAGMQLATPDNRERLALACAQANATHAVSFGTEAGVYQEYGIPVVVCGPGHIDQAHQPDEYIEVAQLEKCIGFLVRLPEYLAGSL